MSGDPIPAAILGAIGALFSGRVYPNAAPDSPIAPFAVYQRVASSPENTLTGIPLDNDRIQVDVYSTTYQEVHSLTLSTRVAILAIAPLISVILISENDAYAESMKLHRVIQEFSFWY